MLRKSAMSLMAFMMMAGTADAQVQKEAQKQPAKPAGVLGFTMKNIDGKEVPLAGYKGKVMLLVNVASKCGQTPQYTQLEELYRKYQDKGFVILGFPANNFGQQEPGTDEEIKEFCSTKYDVTFDMFSKISVKGDDQHPLYRYLTAEETNSAFAGDVKWNFTKFLVNRDGAVVGRFESRVKPMSDEVVAAVEKALQ